MSINNIKIVAFKNFVLDLFLVFFISSLERIFFNKIDAAHKKLFTEKIISRKLALRKKIDHLQEKYEMNNFASLNKEKTINLAYKRLLDKKKNALKFDYSSKLVFDCTFDVVSS